MQKDLKDAKEALVKDLFEAGAHFGYSRARRHPSVNQFIFGYKNGTAVIDLEKTIDSLEEAKSFAAKLVAEGKQILFVGTKSEAQGPVTKVAEELGMPYVTERWIGGTFTNFSQIQKRVARLIDLKERTEKGELGMYTKKERGVLAKELEDLERFFGNIVNMTKLPAAVVVIDSEEEAIAVDEAKQLNIPVISISGSDCDIRDVRYPIVANDNSQTSIGFILNQIKEACQEAKRLAPEPKAEPVNA